MTRQSHHSTRSLPQLLAGGAKLWKQSGWQRSVRRLSRTAVRVREKSGTEISRTLCPSGPLASRLA